MISNKVYPNIKIIEYNCKINHRFNDLFKLSKKRLDLIIVSQVTKDRFEESDFDLLYNINTSYPNKKITNCIGKKYFESNEKLLNIKTADVIFFNEYLKKKIIIKQYDTFENHLKRISKSLSSTL